MAICPVCQHSYNVHFTPRERDVIDGIIAGLGNKQIANILGISEATVKNYTTSIYAKAQCYNRTQVALKFVGKTPYESAL